YQQWVELCCPGWSWAAGWPVFREIENYVCDMRQTRGQHGPKDLRINYSPHCIQEDMVAAAEQTNLTYNEDYNSGDVEGGSSIQPNVRDGKRLNTWRAYLNPILGDPHLTVLTAAHARRLLIEDGNNVTGVEIDHRGRVAQLQANEVVLTAGALASPELLLRSGVGPSADLREVGIEVVHDLAEVGKNLQDHWLSPVIFTTNAQPVPTGEVAPAEVHLFWKSRPDLPVADTQPLFFSVPMYAQDSAPNIQSGPDNGFTLQGGLVRPQSRGEVRLSGP